MICRKVRLKSHLTSMTPTQSNHADHRWDRGEAPCPPMVWKITSWSSAHRLQAGLPLSLDPRSRISRHTSQN